LTDKGFKKCIELDGYRFVFVDYLGKIHDLRPRDSIPSFNNFAKKPEKELYQLLIKALKNQIEELEKGEKYSEEDIEIIGSLKDELDQAESNYARIK
jgi:glycosylphosphatidylinositol transamidase (GPIT) subunit GPI8